MKKQKPISWVTVKKKVSDLKGYDNNPRKMSEAQFRELKSSIEKFNYVEILAVNTDNVIVAGHMRVKALIDLGRGKETIEVRIPNRKLNKKEFEEYLIRSNKTSGEWDFEKLESFFKVDDLKDWGFGENELSTFEALQQGNFEDDGVQYKNQFGVIVICETEEEQQKVFNKLQKEGLNCRVVVT